jgi:murein DD-endopeptidase MepM/ murein hydrolase activator NlpD
VTRPFAPPPADQPWSPGHRGVDLAAAAGAPVRAAGAGRISFAGTVAGRGVVVVDHGALRTTYEPVSPLVTAGDQVVAGALIARLRPVPCGATVVCHDGLHWGLRSGDHYLDPMALLGAGRGPVRLLPFLAGAPGVSAGAAGLPP